MQQTKDLSLALMNALNSKGSEERFSDQVEDLKPQQLRPRLGRLLKKITIMVTCPFLLVLGLKKLRNAIKQFVLLSFS